ncbi:deoxyribonuclease IV [bacterium]|nr:deoxyribonuclease IV [bacterium]
MPYLGAHVSVAGGVSTGVDRAGKISCEAFQFFAKNNKCWMEPPIDPEEIARFRSKASGYPREFLMSHAGYLINLASSNPDVHRRSIESMRDELVRAAALGIGWVVLHPGSHTGLGEERGIRQIVESLQRLLDETRDFRIGILLETTAGQGTSIGCAFEHIAAIRHGLRPARRVGVCVDTCHIFAAGYELRTRDGYESTMKQLDAVIGLRWVKAFHLNDSLKGLGSRVDRHEHIGKGEIGLSGFRFLMNDPRFAALPMVLETPKGPDMAEDVLNLRTLRRLMGRSANVNNVNTRPH